MAAAWDYADSAYLNLKATLDDGTPATAKIDRYLNNDAKYKGYPRNVNADKAKDALLNAIARELKLATWAPGLVFTLDGVTYDRLKLQRVFSGKGSPEGIRNVLLLASRYKHTDAATVREYCTKNIGLDCNGFACNFWGTSADWEIGKYDVNRRTAVADIVAGDAMIFYHRGGNGAAAPPPFHIAVVDEVNVIGDKFQVIVAQSAGEDVGNAKMDQGLTRFDYGTLTPQHLPAKPGPGALYADTTADGVPNTRVFFAAAPTKGKSNV
jgi:hypothetical protein